VDLTKIPFRLKFLMRKLVLRRKTGYPKPINMLNILNRSRILYLLLFGKQRYFQRSHIWTSTAIWVYTAIIGLDENGKASGVKMKGISPNIYFSFDFQDIDLKRTEN